MTNSKMKYRPEIDGLRAIAVIPVILFHLDGYFFRGGFIGVDIFFVISGYLITTIIINEKISKNFSLINFYERRVRRIIPALFFVILITLPLFFLNMSSGMLWDYFQSLVSVTIFMSNFLFALENNYFDIATKYKPFIHTWSLAVEEQFYIIFPIIFLILWKIKYNYIFYFLLLLSTISFVICLYNYSIKIPVENYTIERFNSLGWGSFFMPFGRFWELLIGSIASLILKNFRIQNSNFIATIGFLILIFSFFYINEEIQYPGLSTIFPVFGTFLIIIFSTKSSNLVNLFLSNKILVFIGLISYSLYLWHQPVFTFFNIIYFIEYYYIKIFLQILVILLLSFFTWKYIELPFRDKNKVKSKNLWIIFIISSALIIVVAVLGNSKFGRDLHSKTLSLNINENYHNMIIDMKEEGQNNTSILFDNKNDNLEKSILLIGDSQVFNWQKAIQLSKAKYNFNIETVNFDSICYKYLNLNKLNKNNLCYSMVNKIQNEELIDNNDLVILLESYMYKKDVSNLSLLLKYIKKNNQNIIVVGNAEFSNFTFLSLSLAKELSEGKISLKDLSKIFYKNRSSSVLKKNELIKKIAIENNATFFSEFDLICSSIDTCYLMSSNNEPFFYDNMHLTNAGAKNMADKIVNFIQTRLKSVH